MTQTNFKLNPIQQQVWVRKAKEGDLPLNGEDNEWTLESELRADVARFRLGPSPADVQFAYIPQDGNTDGSSGSDLSFENVLNKYSTDDQVKVVISSHEDELTTESQTVIFEGVLQRHVPTVSGRGGGDESVQFTAYSMPEVLDNRHPDHLIQGIWLPDEREGLNLIPDPPEQDDNPWEAESPDLPAVFNWRGYPNRHGEDDKKFTFVVDEDEHEAFPFTTIEDSQAEYWTGQTALASLIGMKLIGPKDEELNRNADIDSDLLTALTDLENDPEGNLADLTTQLPEVNIQGLGIYDAMDKVCRSIGFRLKIACQQFNAEGEGEGEGEEESQRRYVISVVNESKGVQEKKFKLAERGTTYTDAESLTEANTFNQMTYLDDSSDLVTDVISYSRMFIEAPVLLLPLWKPYEGGLPEATADMQVAQGTFTNEDADLQQYFDRHVSRGADFANYRHMGRDWGAVHVRDFEGYESGDYSHGDEGRDFHSELNMDDHQTEIGRFNIKTRFCSTRYRKPERLRSLAAYGVDYWLEVSETGYGEDGADATWIHVPRQIYSIHRVFFGISLNITNLAWVNIDALTGQSETVLPDKSWWHLINEEKLFFRLTAAIPVDYGAIQSAEQPTGKDGKTSTRYRQAQLLPTNNETTMVHPDSPVAIPYELENEGDPWKIVGLDYETPLIPPGEDEDNPNASTNEQYFEDLKKPIEKRRNNLDQKRISAAVSHDLIDWDAYQIGDMIAGIEGRNIDWKNNLGEGPLIISMTIRLVADEYNGDRQGVTYNLTDEVFTGGR